MSLVHHTRTLVPTQVKHKMFVQADEGTEQGVDLSGVSEPDQALIENSEKLVQQIPELNKHLQDAILHPQNKCKKQVLDRSRQKVEFMAEKLIRARPVSEREMAEVLDLTRFALEQARCQLLEQAQEQHAEPQALVLLTETEASLKQACRDLELRASQLRSDCDCRDLNTKAASPNICPDQQHPTTPNQNKQTALDLKYKAEAADSHDCYCRDRQRYELLDKMKTAMYTTFEVTQNFGKAAVCSIQACEKLAPAAQVASEVFQVVQKKAQELHKKLCEDFSKK